MSEIGHDEKIGKKISPGRSIRNKIWSLLLLKRNFFCLSVIFLMIIWPWRIINEN